MKRRTSVRLALRTRLLTVSSLPAKRVLEGERYKATPGIPYVRELMRPGETVPRGLPTALGLDTTTGVYLVDVFYPIAPDGLAQAEAVAADIAHAFRPGWPNGVLPTTQPDLQVEVLTASSATALADEPFVLVPVTITWQSQVPTAALPVPA